MGDLPPMFDDIDPIHLTDEQVKEIKAIADSVPPERITAVLGALKEAMIQAKNEQELITNILAVLKIGLPIVISLI